MKIARVDCTISSKDKTPPFENDVADIVISTLDDTTFHTLSDNKEDGKKHMFTEGMDTLTHEAAQVKISFTPAEGFYSIPDRSAVWQTIGTVRYKNIPDISESVDMKDIKSAGANQYLDCEVIEGSNTAIGSVKNLLDNGKVINKLNTINEISSDNEDAA